MAGKRTANRVRGAAVLAIDVGNTNTALGVFRGERLDGFWRLATRGDATGDELLTVLRSLLRDHLAELVRSGAVVIGSVVPVMTAEYRAAIQRLLESDPLVVNHTVRTGVPLHVTDPATVGPDRIANSAAVASAGKLPAVVVDLGTATNFDVVDARGRYVGGVIAPGLITSAENLFRRAARLSKVEFRMPDRWIGRTTEECLQSGLFYGATCQIDGIVRGIQKELGRKAYVVATGGLADIVAKGSKTIRRVDPALTLKGLRRILALNVGDR